MITPSSDNLETGLKTPHPTTKKQVRSFLGLVGCYRDLIPAFAEISAKAAIETSSQPSPRSYYRCLTSSRRESQNKYNGMRHRSVLTHCSRSTLPQEPVLKLPDLMKPFVLRTDASELE